MIFQRNVCVIFVYEQVLAKQEHNALFLIIKEKAKNWRKYWFIKQKLFNILIEIQIDMIQTEI